VGLRATAVVRLVGPLAHVKTPSSSGAHTVAGVQGASKLQDATLAECGGATVRPYAALQGWSTAARRARSSSRLPVCLRTE
jgi:hypothetical protein